MEKQKRKLKEKVKKLTINTEIILRMNLKSNRKITKEDIPELTEFLEIAFREMLNKSIKTIPKKLKEKIK